MITQSCRLYTTIHRLTKMLLKAMHSRVPRCSASRRTLQTSTGPENISKGPYKLSWRETHVWIPITNPLDGCNYATLFQDEFRDGIGQNAFMFGCAMDSKSSLSRSVATERTQAANGMFADGLHQKINDYEHLPIQWCEHMRS